MQRNPVYLRADDPTILLLKGAVELGVPMSLMGIALTAFPQAHPGVPVAVWRYTFGPLIVHVNSASETQNLGWLGKETARKWRPRVDIERLEILTGERPDLVSPAELWLTMYNATLAAPLGHALTQIYLWAAQRAYLAAGKALPAGLVQDATWSRLQPTDDEIFDGHFSGEYRELCRAVIRQVVAHSTVLRTARESPVVAPAPAAQT